MSGIHKGSFSLRKRILLHDLVCLNDRANEKYKRKYEYCWGRVVGREPATKTFAKFVHVHFENMQPTQFVKLHVALVDIVVPSDGHRRKDFNGKYDIEPDVIPYPLSSQISFV